MKKKDVLELKKFPIQPGIYVLLHSLILCFVLECLSRRSLVGAWQFFTGNPLVFLLNMLIVAITLSVAFLFRRKLFGLLLISVIWLTFGVSNCILLGFRTASPLTMADLRLAMSALAVMHAYFSTPQIVFIAAAVVAVIALLVLAAIFLPKHQVNLLRGLLRVTVLVCVFLIYAIVIFMNTTLMSFNLRPSLYDSYKEYGFAYCFLYSFTDTGVKRPEDYSPEQIETVAAVTEAPTEAMTTVSADGKTTAVDGMGILPVSGEPSDDLSAALALKGFDPTSIERIIEQLETGNAIEVPESYSGDGIAAIKSALEDAQLNVSMSKPNIIMVQWESFFDPYRLKGVTYSQDPVPNFHALQKQGSTGGLNVPTVAGGTVNTEFEVLSGLSMDYLGAGEFPYYSQLRDKACESVAYDLDGLGYHSTAIHNYTGSFYYRQIALANLGFDTFDSREYMTDYDTTEMGWPKDQMLTGEIFKALNQTADTDFIYTITVQSHGKYPVDSQTTPTITVSGLNEAMQQGATEYYLSQLHDVDAFIGELVTGLEAMNEPVVLVIFGDHLPGLDIADEMLTGGGIYTTDYVVYSNFDLAKEDGTLEAYQLSASVLQRLSIGVGTVIRYHQLAMGMNEEKYQHGLNMLEYDILSGEQYVYGGTSPYAMSNMQMGIDKIRITDVSVKRGNLFVTGENFTYDSRIFLGDDRQDGTVYVSNSLLILPGAAPETGTAVTVGQVSDDSTVLSRADEWMYARS